MKTVLITGISSGIGFHLSLRLAREGWSVFGVVRNREKLDHSLAAIEAKRPERLHVITADINRADELSAALRDVPTPDVLINNAGFGLYGPFEELSDEQLRDQFETNFFSPLRIIRHYLPAMRERQSGRIVNISSILGQMVIPTGSAYCSSKWALEAASEAMRYELAPFGVEVCLVEPGLIRTDFKKNMKLNAALKDESSPYRFLNRLIEREINQYGRFATSPESAADSIVRLMRRRQLPARYRVGADAAFYSTLKSILPGSFLDVILRSYTENLHSKD